MSAPGRRALSAADRRYFDRTDPRCKVCAVRWSRRMEALSFCINGAAPDDPGQGHIFV